MKELTEKETKQIIEEQEDKGYDEYVKLLQDLEWSRLSVETDIEIMELWEKEYGKEVI